MLLNTWQCVTGSASCPNPAGGSLALNEIVTLAGCNFGICYEAGLYYLPLEN
jgi:hypothetical protein